jgi:monodechloroaminopyrrolnitrin synthase
MRQEEILKLTSMQEPFNTDVTTHLRTYVETLRGEEASNQAIAGADPLGIDDALLGLPGLNARTDTGAITEALEQAVYKAQGLTGLDHIQCSAAIRDISMLGASLVRFGIEPADCVAGFSTALMTFSERVSAQIPRDSFIDYTTRNPDDGRERTFTSIPEERLFIDSLRRGIAALNSCLLHMMTACTHSISHRQFAAHFRAAADCFQMMIDSIVEVKRNITPEVFTHHIRPFFEPFRVGGRAFSAPSGAEMPILNIDQIIWGADCTDELYTNYFQANVKRLPAIYQQISRAVMGQNSLITLLKERLVSGTSLNDAERTSIQELHRFLTRMYSFRMPHYKVAEENVILRQREQGEGQEVKGSGGFGLVETKYVLDQTVLCRQITTRALAQ